jgi:PAS domain S-box-containing protein
VSPQGNSKEFPSDPQVEREMAKDGSMKLDNSVQPDGQKIRAAREKMQWSQEWLAGEADVSPGTVENAEAGKRIKRSSLNKIAAALGVDSESLIVPEGAVFTQEMLEAIPLPVFFKDANGIYRGCNELFCKYIGRDRKYIIGKSVYEVAPTEYAAHYNQMDDELLAKPGPQVYESRVVAKATERRVAFYKGTYPAKGKPEGIVGVIVDITDYTAR